MVKQNNYSNQIILTDSEINILSGAASGVLVSALVSPLDVIKTRIQIKRLPKDIHDKPLLITMYKLAQREGFRVFYNGLGTTMLGYIPNWALYFTTYQWSKKQYESVISDKHVLVNMLAAITAGALSNTLLAPIWTIRTRMMAQTNNQHYRNPFHAAQKIYQIEGLYALYRGVIPSMWGLIHVGIQFPLYEYLKNIGVSDSSSNHHSSTGQLIFAASLSKFFASFIAYPHEIVRSRFQDPGHIQQIHEPTSTSSHEHFHEYKNVRGAVKTIAQQEGVRGFYRGIVPTLLRTVPAAVLTLLSYEKIKEFLSDNYSNSTIKTI